MSKPRTYSPIPKRHLTITGFRFGGPGLEFWHEEIRGEDNAEFTVEDFGFVKRTQSELLRLVRRHPAGWEWQVSFVITNMRGKRLQCRHFLASPRADIPA